MFYTFVRKYSCLRRDDDDRPCRGFSSLKVSRPEEQRRKESEREREREGRGRGKGERCNPRFPRSIIYILISRRDLRDRSPSGTRIVAQRSSRFETLELRGRTLFSLINRTNAISPQSQNHCAYNTVLYLYNNRGRRRVEVRSSCYQRPVSPSARLSIIKLISGREKSASPTVTKAFSPSFARKRSLST